MEKSIFNSERERKTSIAVFAVYVFMLLWLVLFKLEISPSEILRIRSINLIPFHYDCDSDFHFREVAYNLIAFAPAGFYTAAFCRRRRILFPALSVFVLSFLLESVQWVFSIGVSDITDIITNTAGGAFGAAAFALLGKITEKYRMKIANTAGISAETGLIVIRIILYISN